VTLDLAIIIGHRASSQGASGNGQTEYVALYVTIEDDGADTDYDVDTLLTPLRTV